MSVGWCRCCRHGAPQRHWRNVQCRQYLERFCFQRAYTYFSDALLAVGPPYEFIRSTGRARGSEAFDLTIYGCASGSPHHAFPARDMPLRLPSVLGELPYALPCIRGRTMNWSKGVRTSGVGCVVAFARSVAARRRTA